MFPSLFILVVSQVKQLKITPGFLANDCVEDEFGIHLGFSPVIKCDAASPGARRWSREPEFNLGFSWQIL